MKCWFSWRPSAPSLSLRDSDDIETYTRFFESFWQAASHGEDAVAIVHRLLDAFGTER